MRAMVTARGAAQVVDITPPVPGPGEALLRIISAGICNTDLEVVRGYHDFEGTLGHEFVAEVVSAPEAPAWAGQRVVGEINVACGVCDFCRRGIPSQCRARAAIGISGRDGAFAEYMALPLRNLHRVPEVVSDDAAVFVEPLAAAAQVLEMHAVRPSERVVVVGAGKLGLLCAAVLAHTGADVVVVARRARAREVLEQWRIPTAPAEALPAKQAAIVVDCTGNAEGFALALELVQPRGCIVLKSTYHGLPQADLTRIAVEEIQVVGSRCGPFPVALRLLETNAIDVSAMIDARYPLEEGVAALDHAGRPGVLKVLLDVAR